MSAQAGRSLTTGLFDTHFHDSGSGAAVVFLHGSGPGVCAWENWAGNLEALGPGRHGIAPDLAGFGETRPAPGQQADAGLWCGQIIDLLDALGKERAVFVGNSLGGFLSIQMALNHADRVAGLVLMGTPGGEFEMTPALAALQTYEPSVENMRVMLEMFPADPSLVTDEMVAKRHARSVANLQGTQMHRKQAEAAHEAAPRRIQATPLAKLARIAVPTLIVHGAMDRVLPPAIAVSVHGAIPGSSLVIYGNAGHWAQVEKRDWFNRDLCAFLDEIGWNG